MQNFPIKKGWLSFFLAIIFSVATNAQSPQRKFTYIIDSIKYMDNSMKEWGSLPTSPLKDFLSIDYSINQIRFVGNPTNPEKLFHIIKFQNPDKDSTGQAVDYITVCADPQDVVCMVHCMVFNDNWKDVNFMIQYSNGKTWLYFAKKM